MSIFASFERLCLLIFVAAGASGLTNYEYFAPIGGIHSGLMTEGKQFVLNGRDITIYSGAFHYFRVHPQYWRNTLKKLRAAGLNAVETYMPWNLHNPRMGVFDYGDLGEDWSEFLDLRTFLMMAQQEDLFVIMRPGPYICSEWDFGGLPSWLLRDYTMQVRSTYKNFTDAVDQYYHSFAQIINDLDFSKGGSIIAMQIENEFGHFGYEDQPRETIYMEYIRDLMDECNFGSLLYFTSDSIRDKLDWGALPGVLMTSNFQRDVDGHLDALEMLQPDKPTMVMEFWTGWYDYWLGPHTTVSPVVFAQTLEGILIRNSSVNFYMFIGGTNFGFMSGANSQEPLPIAEYLPMTTSYDYDALLTETGNYTLKYNGAQYLIETYNPLSQLIPNPTRPPVSMTKGYGARAVVYSLSFDDLMMQTTVSVELTDGPIAMELLDINDGNGQSYGYIVYEAKALLPQGNLNLTIKGRVRDMAQVMINGELVTGSSATIFDIFSFGFWGERDCSLEFYSPGGEVTVTIMVENLGRVNFGVPDYFQLQKKGLYEGPIIIGEDKIKEWTATPLEFKKDFVNSLSGWQEFTGSFATPAVHKAFLVLNESPRDTHLDMSEWGKGVVFVNGFNLGRYWSQGPQITLYIPAPLLIEGTNEFVVFEQYEAASELAFIDYPILSKR